mmetsp:Transcript_18389/g.24002  ORF Transcript_18389/g.24002 Transcript_18389/m.24002 type:complete len:541 (+) Transcript_18389:169-1791(+)
MGSPQLQVGSGLKGLLKDGYKELSGVEMAIIKNIEACSELGKTCRTSLGPNGMNKLLINHLDKVFVTSNAGTILGELEVIHPAAKMIVMAAKSQEEEYGDCTNFVLTFAAELLNQAYELLRIGVHPSDIISGYKIAASKSLELLESLVCHKVADMRNEEELTQAIKSVVAAKQYGYEDLLGSLVSEACQIVIPSSPKLPSVNMDHVRLAKLMGGNIHMSSVLKGMVIRRPPASLASKKENAKVAVFGTAIEASQTETKGTVKITSADELKNYNKSEESLLDEQIRGIKESGVDVLISGGSISHMALHFIDKYDMLAVKVSSKFELRRLCRTVGAVPLVRLGPVMPDEMGHCDLVETREIAGGRCVVFQQNDEESAVATVLIRSATTSQLDDVERALSDGVNAVKTLCEDPRLLPGGGACEIGLANIISKIGESRPGLEQYGINRFATALEIVPRILAENAGKDPTEILSNLHAAHKKGDSNMGVDIESGGIADMKEASILDPYVAKHQALRLATDVAITILRVDQLIMSKQAGGPKLPKQ